MMAYLTNPEAKVTKARTYRYFVELASLELDCEGVPESFQIVEVVVLEPTREAIKTVIAAADWLKGYTIVSHWNPNDCTEFQTRGLEVYASNPQVLQSLRCEDEFQCHP